MLYTPQNTVRQIFDPKLKTDIKTAIKMSSSL